jgi:putative flippase GtrA
MVDIAFCSPSATWGGNVNFGRQITARGGVGRASLSSCVATASDYGLFVVLLRLGCMPALATVLGCLLGGIVNFTVNRHWAFEGHGPLRGALGRYALVSSTSAAANALMVAIQTSGFGFAPRPAWGLARVLVFLLLTYPLFRGWVFGTKRRPEPELIADPVEPLVTGG